MDEILGYLQARNVFADCFTYLKLHYMTFEITGNILILICISKVMLIQSCDLDYQVSCSLVLKIAACTEQFMNVNKALILY